MTDWLLGGILLTLVAHTWLTLIDNRAIAHRLETIVSSFIPLREEIAKLRIELEKRR